MRFRCQFHAWIPAVSWRSFGLVVFSVQLPPPVLSLRLKVLLLVCSLTDDLVPIFTKFGHRTMFCSHLRCAQVLCLLSKVWPSFLLLAGDEAERSLRNVITSSAFLLFAILNALLASLSMPSPAFNFSSPGVQNSSGGVWRWVVYCFLVSSDFHVRVVVYCVWFTIRAAFSGSAVASKTFSWYVIERSAFTFLALLVDPLCCCPSSYFLPIFMPTHYVHFLRHQERSPDSLSRDSFKNILVLRVFFSFP